jgi:hypothetical protein
LWFSDIKKRVAKDITKKTATLILEEWPFPMGREFIQRYKQERNENTRLKKK